MLRRCLAALALVFIAAPSMAQLIWHEGTEYKVIAEPQRADAPNGKIEVAEVFSYGCPYCYSAQGNMEKLAAQLPEDAAMTYVHAAFRSDEAWPMFQRAFYAARKLGIAEANHKAMFAAIWETAEIPLIDTRTSTLKRPPPTIEHAAKFYARVSKVSEAEFLKVANSPEIDTEMRRADELIKTWRVPGTPSLVVNGRYLVSNDLPFTQQINLVKYLVGLERRNRN